MTLVAEALGCARGGRLVLQGVDFTLKGGEALIVRGPNAVGKTTLLRVIAGLLDPSEGRLTFEAGDADGSDRRDATHYVGHLNAVKSQLSVRETLAFQARMLGGTTAGVAPALSSWKLEGLEDVPAGLLSAGQRRRLALARLQAARRPLWVLDEPTVALDADGERLFVAAVTDHLAEGGLAVIATHGALDLAGAATLHLEQAAP